MEEVHLFIVWSNGLDRKKDIINDISENFLISRIYNVSWSKQNFSSNLTRFYGENLPKNSDKEKHCGNDTFCCIVVRDKKPLYEIRDTSKGPKVVNTKLFDAKQLYREWTGGGHKIHATDNIAETKLQLALLFKESYDNFLKYSSENEEIDYKNDLAGANGWESFEELFNILNITAKYVVLRNYDNLENQLSSLHPDVDLLVENKSQVADIINAKATTNKHYRVQYSTKIQGKNINFDLRYIGDDYYDYRWENSILENRKQHGYLYVPDDMNHFFSLLYHALIHKRSISRDYLDSFIALADMNSIKLSTSDLLEENLLDILLKYMYEKRYEIVAPVDLSVYFNKKLLDKKIAIKITKQRERRNNYLNFRSKVKLILIKVLKRLRIA